MGDHFSVQRSNCSCAMPGPEHGASNQPRLLEQVRHTLRRKHYSLRTEQTYIHWIKRYIYFHGKQHPKDLNEAHVTDFLTDLAVHKNVASSTQNQAMCALIFLYRKVIKKDLGEFENLVYAKRPSRLPVVFSRDEVRSVLLQLEGVPWIMAQLLYGAGLRLMECVRLRVKDVDFSYKQIVVRDGKGQKDRVTMLPVIAVTPLNRHLEKIRQRHEIDLKGMSLGTLPIFEH